MRRLRAEAAAWLELPAILSIFLLATRIVRPFGDFPLDDDENHAIGVWNFLHLHRFVFAIDTTPPLRAQVVWGALWAHLFGESFDVLRASTLILGGLTLILINRMLADAGVGLPVRVVATLAFLFNPIWFWSTHTFMTETPYIFASVLSVFCFARALRGESVSWFLTGCVAVAISWWIRQGIVNIFPPIILLACYRGRLTRKWKTMLSIAVLVAVGYAAMAIARPDLIVASPVEFRYHYKVWQEPTFRLPEMAAMIFSIVFFNVQNVALFYLPLSLAACAFVLLRRQRWVVATAAGIAVVMLLRMAQLVARGIPIPYYGKNAWRCWISWGNVFMNFGLGPPTIGDVWSLVHEYSLALPFSARVWLSYVSVIIAAVALTALIVAVRDRIADPKANVIFLLCAAGALVGTATLPVSQQYVDRYSIDTCWGAAVLFAIIVPWQLRSVRVLTAGALIVLAVFCIGATQEYFAWNRARWAAWWDLRNQGLAIKQIDGGAEPFLYYELSQARTDQERRRASVMGTGTRQYVIAFAPLPACRVLRTYPFSGWFGLHRSSLVTLERIGWRPAPPLPVRRPSGTSGSAAREPLRQRE